MSFTIAITETRQVKKIVEGKWDVVGTKEVEREERFFRGDQKEPKTRIEEVRDYLPPKEMTVETEVEVLKQTVNELDLPSVIKAINKL